MIRALKSIMEKTYGHLPKEIYVMFIGTIINRMGSFIRPFLTFFLTQKLGMSAVETGIYVALTGIAGLSGNFIGGFIGDYGGRKKNYVIAQSLAGIMLLPCGFFVHNFSVVFFLIASYFFNAIVYPINTTMVSDLVGREDRARAYSLIYYGINLGVAIGPLIAGFLYNHYIQWFFWGDAITTFIASILVLIFVKETKLSKEELETINPSLHKNEQRVQGGLLNVFLQRPVLIIYTIVSVLVSFVYAQGEFALPLTLSHLFGDTKGPLYFGHLISFNAIVVLALTILVTKITLKYKPLVNIAAANIFYMIGFGMLAFTHILPIFYLSTIIWSIGEIIGATQSGVFVMNHTPISHRGRLNGSISFVKNLGSTLAPVISGLLMSTYSLDTFWIIIGGIAGLAALGMGINYLIDFRFKPLD